MLSNPLNLMATVSSLGVSEWCFCSISCVIVVSCVYLNILYVIYNIKNWKPINCILFYCSQIFILFSISSMITVIIRVIFPYLLDNALIRLFLVIFYGNQMSFLYLVLFLRLKMIFHGTSYELSKIVVYIYMILFIILCLIIISLIIFHSQLSILGMLTSSSLLLSTILNINITILFVKKLFQVFKKNNDNNNNRIVNIITKTTILAIVSCTFTVLVVVSLILATLFTAYRESIVYPASLLMDSYTNSICVLLSFNVFQSKYDLLCRCLDAKCKSLCRYMTQPQQLQKNMEKTTCTTAAIV